MPPQRRRRATAVPQKQTETTKTTKIQSSEADSSDEGGAPHMETNVKTKQKVHKVEKAESDMDDLMEELTPLISDTESSGSESSDEEDWENCLQGAIDSGASTTMHETPLGDLEVILEPNKIQSWTAGKKGISGMERKIRMTAHMLHVQFLLYHGFRRNAWLCDEELQAILLSHVTPGISAQVEKYHQARKNQLEALQKAQKRGKGKAKSNGVTSSANSGSGGVIDPLVHLLGILIHFWKKKFTINAPGIRKKGYMSMAELAEALHPNDKVEGNGDSLGSKASNGGEKIENLNVYRQIAARLEGSRDIGAQLFTALLRALGFETRMVFSLQPLGFNFNGGEMLNEKKIQIGGPSSLSKVDPSKVKEDKKPASDVSDVSKKPRKRKRASTSESDVEDTGSEPNKSGKQVINPKKLKLDAIDKDLLFPVFWTEVFSPHTSSWVAVDALVTTKIFFRPETFCQLEPRGKQAQDSKQVICYVIAYSSDFTAKDVTVRYLTKNILPGKTKGFRVSPTIYPVKDNRGDVIRNHKYDWFRSIMRRYTKIEDLKDEQEKNEDEALQGIIIEKKNPVNEESISGYKNHPDFILERHLKREEAVKPDKSHVKLFTIGKGDKAKEEKVFRRRDIVTCKTIENWYREGRVVKEGEAPLKRVKSRAVTLNRKRELEQAAAENNPIKQGLYSYDQTKLYDPPQVQNGKVPRNGFGNCDVYVQTMIPKDGAHLPLKGSAKIAKKLGIDYADAVTGFEFKKQRAVPVIEGIVIPAEHEGLIRDAWTAEEKERKRKEDLKREGVALALWRRFLMGIRIVKRIQEEYGNDNDEIKLAATAGTIGGKKEVPPAAGDSEPEEGGFLRDDRGEAHISADRQACLDNTDSPKEENPDDTEGGFIREEEDEDEDHNINQIKGGDFINDDIHTTQYQKIGHTQLNDTLTLKRRRVSHTTTSSPQKQMIRSLKYVSAASGNRSAATEDSSTDEDDEEKGKESTYFFPRKPTHFKEPQNQRNGIFRLSNLTNPDYELEAPPSSTGTIGVTTSSDANNPSSPSPQKLKTSGRGRGRKDIDIVISRSAPTRRGRSTGSTKPSSSSLASSSSPHSVVTPPKSTQKTPRRQAAVAATRRLQTTRSKYFLLGGEDEGEED